MPLTMSTAFNKLSIFVIILFPVSCIQDPEAGSEAHIRQVISAVDHSRIVHADDFPEDWLTTGRNYSEDRYSDLDQITKFNINELGLAWSINLGVYSGIKSTPIVADGIMYLSGPWSKVYAIDVRKGEIIWIYDPQVPREYGIKACCDVVNRGVSMYKGLVYVGTLDGRLVAIEAATGKRVWEKLTVDRNKPYRITGGTRVFNGKVLIGNSGGEYGVRGYVTAYDAVSGKQVWRFYTVPGNTAIGFESESPDGGGSVVDGLVYDPDLDLIYIGTGKGFPMEGEKRSSGGGDRLYLNSILALHLESGELEWFYQQTPGEALYFSANQPIILADFEIEDSTRKVLMQAPENGFFYVLDRTNGERISVAPYTESIHPESNAANEESYWHPMSYNRATGLVYLPAGESSEWEDPKKEMASTKKTRLHEYGKLLAWDPVKQKEVWSVRQVSNRNGGVLSTRDLVFQGDARGMFRAFDASSGKSLWSYDLGTGIMAAPSTFLVDGTQYVSVAVGWGGSESLLDQALTEKINPGTVYTFALGKKETPPEFE